MGKGPPVADHGHDPQSLGYLRIRVGDIPRAEDEWDRYHRDSAPSFAFSHGKVEGCGLRSAKPRSLRCSRAAVKPPVFDPLGAIEQLVRHDVEFVLIGGLAMRALGSNRVTNDIDICYHRTPENLGRLASALRAMAARRISDLYPEGVEVNITVSYLEREDMFAFMTNFGQLDCLASPAGIEGFGDLKAGSLATELGAVTAQIASPGALRRMKTARAWAVDQMDLLVLDEIEHQERG